MAVSGVRSSCETLATKSRRMRSARFRSVTSCSTTTTPRPVPATGARRATSSRAASRVVENSKACEVPPASRRPTCSTTPGCRSASTYGRPTASLSMRSIRARRLVHELQPAALVDDEHAFDHAAENGLHARAIAHQRRDAPFLLVHGGIEGAGRGAELVVAVVGSRPAQVAERVAAGDVGNGLGRGPGSGWPVPTRSRRPRWPPAPCRATPPRPGSSRPPG